MNLGKGAFIYDILFGCPHAPHVPITPAKVESFLKLDPYESKIAKATFTDMHTHFWVRKQRIHMCESCEKGSGTFEECTSVWIAPHCLGLPGPRSYKGVRENCSEIS